MVMATAPGFLQALLTGMMKDVKAIQENLSVRNRAFDFNIYSSNTDIKRVTDKMHRLFIL